VKNFVLVKKNVVHIQECAKITEKWTTQN